MRLLLAHAAVDANQARQNGMTPLFMAAQEGHEALVRALMEAGATVDDDGYGHDAAVHRRGMATRRWCGR